MISKFVYPDNIMIILLAHMHVNIQQYLLLQYSCINEQNGILFKPIVKTHAHKTSKKFL